MPVGEQATKLTLAALYLGGLGALSVLLQRRDEPVHVERSPSTWFC